MNRHLESLMKMQFSTTHLAVLLAAQLVLALLLSVGGSGNGSFQAKEPLLAFDAGAVDGIDIDESGANSVSLAKRNGAWVVPSMADFPVDAAKISDFLKKIAEIKKGWPVATSSDAAQRFKVTDDAHERRIILKSNGKTLGEVLLGTSPSFKQTHARGGNDSNIYSVAFATYDVAPRPEDWINRDILDVPQDKVASISVGDVTIDRKDGKFTLAGLAEGEKQNDAAVWKLAGAVTRPTFDAVQGKGTDALAKVNDPDIQITIKRTDGASILLKYKKEAAGGAYLFGSSTNDFLFRVAEASIEPITKAKRDALIESKKSAGDDAHAVTGQEAQSKSGG